ncbi:hypothetical protein [Mycobacterium basiliense]|uniref:hypothetical protein n=1 Tax=Mycobacterium basiliense TaxID=2094119 RepID=UPI0013017CAF|nr:hypothetical protein [Mycobacterium basiliense]
MSSQGIHTDLGTAADPLTEFGFHDYCAFESAIPANVGCAGQDGVTFLSSTRHNHLSKYRAW